MLRSDCGTLAIMVMILAAGFCPAWCGDGEYDGWLRVDLLVSGGGAGVEVPVQVDYLGKG